MDDYPHSPAALAPGKEPLVPTYRRPIETKRCFGRFEEDRNIFPTPETEPPFLSYTIRNLVCYRRRDRGSSNAFSWLGIIERLFLRVVFLILQLFPLIFLFSQPRHESIVQ